jgi:hypothetical protein
MKLLSKNLIAVLAGIAFGLLQGFIETEVSMPLLVEHVFVINPSPAKQFHPSFPLLSCSICVRGKCSCPDGCMTAVRGDNPQPHCYVETPIIIHKSRFLVSMPWRVLHDFTAIGNDNVVCWGITTVLNPQLELIRFLVANLCNYVSPIRVDRAFLRAFNVTFEQIPLVVHRAQLTSHSCQLTLCRISLFPRQRDRLPHLYQLLVVNPIGRKYAKDKERRKDRYRFSQLAGVGVTTMSLLPIWFGIGLLRVGNFGFGFLLITGGLFVAAYGMSKAITEQKEHGRQGQDERSVNDDFNGECFPSHLAGKCNTKSLDNQN